MITTMTTTEKAQTIQGPEGLLELIVGEPTSDARNVWGIVCHPHPLHGGTMHNKVVTTLIKAFQNRGCHTVRFNFRGVGKSEGKFDQGAGELEDLLAVINWVQLQKPLKEIWLAGFSFGACIAAKAATEIPTAKLVTIAPAVAVNAMQNLPPIKAPWLLAIGLKDDVVSPKDVLDWAERRNPAPDIIKFPDAGHFFHGSLGELRTRVEAWLGS